MKRFAIAAFVCLWSMPVLAQETAISPDALEFFEKKVRPVLAEHCYACHSGTAKKLKAGLLLDSRKGMLDGGDNGTALVPGNPEKSKIIEAIRYTNVDLKMPPKSKLPDAVVADLTAWVKMGAPWPDEKTVKKTNLVEFDLPRRKKEHWSWQPIRVPAVPAVKDAGWARTEIDRFLLAKLEEKGIKPAPAAEPSTLLRRVYLDIIGLPPTRDEVDDFVKAWNTANGNRQAVFEGVVEKLLASPRFGERWGRHWLDLTRYAESRGHEFDYTIPNAYQYRDYVIRALNADVPYNQFVAEHLAGDLLKNPRLHPTEGYNESILGTGFWFLGEEVHSPVDIRQDQADRFDNRLDVMTKTFLGLTVSCARCHDHKFDAISTKDYYALFGILESSNYRLARFDSIAHNRKIAEQLWELREKSRRPLQEAIAKASLPTVKRLADYLRYDRERKINPDLLNLHSELVDRWGDMLTQAGKNESSPLHAFARVAADRKRPVQEVLQPILKKWQAQMPMNLMEEDIVVDYRKTPMANWLPDDVTFGSGPVRPGDIILGESVTRPIVRVVEQAAAERDHMWDYMNLATGAQNESGTLGSAVRPGFTLRTPEFILRHGRAYALVKGSGMIYAGVGQHIMLAGPLHGSLVQHFNTGDKFQWVAIDLMPYKGQRTHLEFTPNYKDYKAGFAIVAVVESLNTPAAMMPASNRFLAGMLAKATTIDDVANAYQDTFQTIVNRLENQDIRIGADAADLAPLINWFVQNRDLFITDIQFVAKAATPFIEQQQKLVAQIKLRSRLAPAMQDGSGTAENVFNRGNHKTPGPLVPRRFLEALAGPDPLAVKSGSGRLELAQQMTDPAVTPFITRVYVNRVWHHLFGRGIVASVDNFGVLGEAPTHPELLDYLADKFAKEEGWSLKKLIRVLVLTQAYQMSSHPEEKADQADPQDLLLHRMRLRRLEGEAIRDSILRVSGRLNPAMYGPAVPIFLTPFQDGRGRPGGGPLDGDGRRSIYLGVRRNFLSSFLLAFDTPAPFSTVGRRTISNVPAQALILMNDPFVHGQAEVWAKRVQAEKGTHADRVCGMYLDAFSRPPSESELQACLAYLSETPDARRWTDLAHVLFNTKEFYFVN